MNGTHRDQKGSTPTSRGDDLRRLYPRAFAIGLVLSAVLHAVGITMFSASLSGPVADRPAEMVLLPPAPESATPAPPTVDVPPSPDPIPRPATPVAAPVESPEIPELIPHDVPPRLENAEEVRRRLLAAYPDTLRNEGVQGMVVLWLFVDEAGEVRQLQLRSSSGHRSLDTSARQVAHGMAFRPALHRGDPIGVWVSQPIRFQVRLPPEPDSAAALAEDGATAALPADSL